MNRAAKAILVLALVAGAASAMPAGSRITLPGGKKIFVSGMNLAWTQNNYANDVVSFDSAALETAFKAVRDSGGNTFRIWLSTNGSKDPVFAGGYVSGPNPATIPNVQKMLRIAKRNGILLLLSLTSHNYMQNGQGGNLANNTRMWTTDSGMDAFCSRYVDTLVKTIGKDPSLLAWEVANEPEGMVSGIGWTDNRISQANVQKFVAKVAAAVHKACPGILVTNGTVQESYQNWYTDAALQGLTSDASSYLDFYTVHYYGWNGTGNSPFQRKYAAWNLDKPLVVAEYASGDWSPSTHSSSALSDAAKVDTLLAYLDTAGYAGGLGWMYYPTATGDTWLTGFPTFGHSIRLAWLADSNSIKLAGGGASNFAVSVAATSGGSVGASVVGRVDSGKADTIRAVAATGYTFSGWSGDTAGTTIVGTMLIIPRVTRDYVIQATFRPDANTNLIKGGTFATAADQDDWELGTYPTPANAATLSFAGAKAAVTVTASDTTNYGVQLRQSGIQIDSGATYLITFDASSTVPKTIQVALTTGSWKWQSSADASLTASTQSYSATLTSKINAADGLVQFCIGKILSTVTIDNVTMVRMASAVAPRIPLAREARWSLVRSGADIAWTRSEAVASAGTLRLVDASGRELSRAPVAAGSRSGAISAPASGVAFLVLETSGAREIRTLPPVR